jgi:hypothetical protein
MEKDEDLCEISRNLHMVLHHVFDKKHLYQSARGFYFKRKKEKKKKKKKIEKE